MALNTNIYVRTKYGIKYYIMCKIEQITKQHRCYDFNNVSNGLYQFKTEHYSALGKILIISIVLALWGTFTGQKYGITCVERCVSGGGGSSLKY